NYKDGSKTLNLADIECSGLSATAAPQARQPIFDCLAFLCVYIELSDAKRVELYSNLRVKQLVQNRFIYYN
ncbi:MAG: hypothetical protein RR049_03520, partial [Angelakisella sp.]